MRHYSKNGISRILKYIRKLIMSMPDRVDMFRRKRGGDTKY